MFVKSAYTLPLLFLLFSNIYICRAESANYRGMDARCFVKNDMMLQQECHDVAVFLPRYSEIGLKLLWRGYQNSGWGWHCLVPSLRYVRQRSPAVVACLPLFGAWYANYLAFVPAVWPLLGGPGFGGYQAPWKLIPLLSGNVCQKDMMCQNLWKFIPLVWKSFTDVSNCCRT